MFRKIVTELAYSPTLAENLGFYVKQLRSEVSVRQVGLIFTLLAVVVQLIAALFPPESANAHNPDIFIDAKLQSIQDYLEYYDQNANNIRDLLASLGITRSAIEAAQRQTLASGPRTSLWSVHNDRTEESRAYFFPTTNEKSGVAYYRPLPSELLGTEAYVGSSSSLGGWFAITANGANLVTENRVPSTCSTWLASPNKPLRVDSWTNDPECLSMLDLSLEAREISSDSTDIGQLRALDRVAYTLSIKNKRDTAIPVTPSINLEDTLEYSRILDYGGGSYDFDTKNLAWRTTTLPAGGNITKTFIVQLLPSIPATARGQYISASYDCTVSMAFGNVLSTPVDCPFAKQVEQVANSLPRLSKSFNVIAAVLLAAAVAFLYARSRQLLSEIYIIRHNHLGGL